MTITSRDKKGRALKTHGMSRSRVYSTWANMLDRCYNPNCNQYPRYGGRGIKVDLKWHSFEGFYSDMGDKPVGMSLDRINVNMDYSPSNCRWADMKVQSNNRRNSVIYHWGNMGITSLALSWITGVSRATIMTRVARKWPLEKQFLRRPL